MLRMKGEGREDELHLLDVSTEEGDDNHSAGGDSDNDDEGIFVKVAVCLYGCDVLGMDFPTHILNMHSCNKYGTDLQNVGGGNGISDLSDLNATFDSLGGESVFSAGSGLGDARWDEIVKKVLEY